jgi:membrane protein YqaA with SNARE-associated domain
MHTEPQGTRTPGKRQGPASRQRIILILCESALVLSLLLVWVLSEGVRASTNLAILFFYSFPSEFLVGLVPHEPVLIYYGSYHPAWVVALVAVVSTVMAEGLNYSLFGLFYSMPTFRAALGKAAVKRIAELFSRMPFTAIFFAGFSPVPFFPVRFLVVITEYPVWKYLLGVFLSRAPRFYLLALIGAFFDVPAPILAAIFLAMLVLVNLPALSKLLGNERNRVDLASQPKQSEAP